MKSITFSIFIGAMLIGGATKAIGQSLFTNDFQSVEVGKVPEGLTVLDGQFAVQEDGGDKFLELPGAPTDTYTVIFGPVTNANIEVSARILATAKGRRMPAFGISVCGVGGYKLQISPAKKAVELFKGETLLQTVEHSWQSGEWASLSLKILPVNEGVRVEGKVVQEKAEPLTITLENGALLNPGRSGIFGTPFSGLPIRFDDLAVNSVK